MFTDVEMVALLRAKRREVRRGGAASVLPATPFCAATDEPVRAHERPGGHALGVVNLRVHRRSLHDHDRLLLHHDGRLHGHGHGLGDDNDLDARGGRKSSGCHATRPPPRRAAPRSGRGVSDGGLLQAAGRQPTAKHNTHLRLGDGERHRRNLGGNGNRLSAYGRGHGRRHPAVL